MIEPMRQLGLLHIYLNTGGSGNPEAWYRHLRMNAADRLFPFFIEAAKDSMSSFYFLRADPQDPDLAVLEQRPFDPARDGGRLPFVQSTGSQSPALGPVLKRTFKKGEGGGPSPKILASTLKAFRELADKATPWADYFAEAASVLARPRLQLGFKPNAPILEGTLESPALMMAVQHIDEKKTCFLSFLDSKGKLPGERDDYTLYLQSILAAEKYSTGRYGPVEDGACALTGEQGTVFPNALTGAGLNITNVDRIGVFAGLQEDNAWKKFPLTAATADLIFTFNFHVRGKHIGRVAGEQALILPHLNLSHADEVRDEVLEFMRGFSSYVQEVKDGKPVRYYERDFLYYAEHPEVANTLTLLWADFGQKLDNVQGMITDVFPSRLSQMSIVLQTLFKTTSVLFPEYPVPYAQPDLAFNGLSELLKRPGGVKTRKENEGKQRREFVREVAAAAYHAQPFEPIRDRFMGEFIRVAQAYLAEALNENQTYGLLHEGRSKDNKTFLTLVGWVKHMALFRQYLTLLEGKENKMHESTLQLLPPDIQAFLTDQVGGAAALDTPEKLHAFMLGCYFGRLLDIQEARGVNSAANVLSWLKRFEFSGKDLPELHKQITAKFAEYRNDPTPVKSSNWKVKDLARSKASQQLELAVTKCALQGPNTLSRIEAPYYFLLGQSISKPLTQHLQKPSSAPEASHE